MAIFIGWLIGSLIGNIIVLALKIVVYSIKWTVIILYHIIKFICELVLEAERGYQEGTREAEESKRPRLMYNKV